MIVGLMSRSILVVDDDAAILRMYAMALGTLGEVVSAQSGAEALVCLEERRFDAMILDLFMPGIGGLDVLDRINEPKALNYNTPVFVVTADQSERSRLEAMKRRAIFQLTKPVPIRLLVEQVRAQLERKPRTHLGSPTLPTSEQAR